MCNVRKESDFCISPVCEMPGMNFFPFTRHSRNAEPASPARKLKRKNQAHNPLSDGVLCV